VPQATSPFGEPVSVTLTNRQSFTGELLAVTDSSLILMVRDRVAFARAGSIARARLRGFGLEYTNGARPSSRSLERARRSARFPYGVSPEVMAVLLGRTSQSAPDDLATLQP
jgi:hypothetical protein